MNKQQDTPQVVEIRGDALGAFLAEMEEISGALDRHALTRLSFFIDEGLKVKVDNYTWSLPFGSVA